jgi:hypothetical protein
MRESCGAPWAGLEKFQTTTDGGIDARQISFVAGIPGFVGWFVSTMTIDGRFRSVSRSLSALASRQELIIITITIIIIMINSGRLTDQS